jgi:hypothetical protein
MILAAPSHFSHKHGIKAFDRHIVSDSWNMLWVFPYRARFKVFVDEKYYREFHVAPNNVLQPTPSRLR